MEIQLKNKPKLTLVGAGYGDPELITLKAINALRQADVVLYDALASPELLDYCHPLCEKIFVGKKGHQRGISQDSINFLIIEKAYEKGHVVRLKGGDPFVFGRGKEEIDFASQRGIECDYVPGISSAFSFGKYLIPLTEREVSDGFWVLTGCKSDKSLSRDIDLAIQSESTVVLLMAVNKIPQICQKYIAAGKGEINFFIVQNAGTSNEKSFQGKTKNMEEISIKNKIKNPAVLIIGNVVRDTEISNNDIYHKDLIEIQSKHFKY